MKRHQCIFVFIIDGENTTGVFNELTEIKKKTENIMKLSAISCNLKKVNSFKR